MKRILLTVLVFLFWGCKFERVSPEVNHIVVSKLPNKIEYFTTDIFDSTGMEVIAIYNDGSSQILNDYFTNFDDIKKRVSTYLEIRDITISYSDRINTTISLTISPPPLYSLHETPIFNLEENCILFGDYPCTKKGENIKLSLNPIAINATEYYLGSDGNYYCPLEFFNYDYHCFMTCYFKVEPIRWKILTENYDGSNNLLLATEKIISTSVPFFIDKYNGETQTPIRKIKDEIINPNNYKYSTIRAFLNGKTEDGDITNEKNIDKGFLQMAFSSSAKKIIEETEIENNFDKLFILSSSDMLNSAYGFSNNESRSKYLTDFAAQERTMDYNNFSELKGMYFLRDYTESCRNSEVCGIAGNGGFYYYYCQVNDTRCGIVPAMCINPEYVENFDLIS